MPDRFETHASGLDAPASHGFSITPHDTNELAEITRALYVGGAGNVSVVLASGAQVLLSNVPAGTLLPLRARLVRATATSATAIVGLV